MLNIINVSKKYGSRVILNKVSCQVKKGQIAVLLGSSGVGKSTLLRILAGLENYDQGIITLENKPLTQTTGTRAQQVGMVFQHFNLFDHLTVERNVTLALECSGTINSTDAKIRAQKLLAHYGIQDKATMYPSQLSGGQKQRLALARALALEPEVICMDEPTSALDPQLTSTVLTAIEQLAHENYIVVIATHDITLIEKLPCFVYLMEQGTIVENAHSSELKTHSNAYPKIKKFIAGAH